MAKALCIISTPLPGTLLLKPRRFPDPRGFFTESYNKRDLAEAGIAVDFVQDNLSFSAPMHTLRGLHFQTEPCAQAKLVSVVSGSVLDVAVDLRKTSPTLGRHFAVELSAAEGNQLFVPAGFAHGFLTLEPNTLFSYKVSAFYSPENDTGIRFDDPTLAIDWGVCGNAVLTSDKDRDLPFFEPHITYFPQDSSPLTHSINSCTST